MLSVLYRRRLRQGLEELRLKKNRLLLVWSMLLSAIFIGLASKSSPLYPLNDWVDVNYFFSMGRFIVDGMVPYRDLYEHKGPVLYFVFAIIALFSQESYVGVYLLEVVTYGLFLFYSGLIAQLYLDKTRIIYLLIAIIAALLPMSWSFTHGGSVEQHCLFMLAYALYSFLRAMQENRALSAKEAIINGVFAGIMLWIKYTMLGFYLGLALFVIVWYFSTKQTWKQLLLTIGHFFIGIAAVSFVVFLYFAINGALSDLFNCYFYDNIVRYPSVVEGSRFAKIFECLKGAFKNNPSYAWMLRLGIVWLVWNIYPYWRTGLMLAISFLGLTLGTYWGCKGWDYYGFIFAAYSVFGLIGITQLLRFWHLRELYQKIVKGSPIPFYAVLVITVALLFNSAVNNNRNMYMTKYDQDETVQYRFAKIIQTVEDPTLLNYGFLDGGFFYASGAKPADRYFSYTNISPNEMWQSQKECIENGEADFIVTRKYQLSNYTPDSSQYQLVDQMEFPFSKTTRFTYYLYQKITD